MKDYREWYYLDKSEVTHGPWVSEPDKCHWIDEETGYDCLIRRATSPMMLLGYVGIKDKHPLFKNDVGAPIDVHGDITYSGHFPNIESIPPTGYMSEDGDDQTIWWIGFDCGHGGDLIPGDKLENSLKMAYRLTAPYLDTLDVYRDLDFVKKEIKSLALQIARFDVFGDMRIIESAGYKEK